MATSERPAPTLAALQDRLLIAEETMRAMVAGEVDAIVLGIGSGRTKTYKLESEDLPYRLLVERMTDGAALVDADGLIVYANRHLATLLAVPLERLIGGTLATWLAEPDKTPFILRRPIEGSTADTAHTFRRSDGSRVVVRVGISTMEETHQSLHCLVVTDLTQERVRQRETEQLNADLTEKFAELARAHSNLQDAEVRLLHQAMHDPVTGLPNRALYLDRLTQALAETTRSGLPVTVYFIDLDGFKQVNDALGHHVGDRVLRKTAARLAGALRPADTVARFAGDEFVLLTPQTDEQLGSVLLLADRILGALHDPPLQEGTHVVHASMGLAISHGEIQAEELIREADAAMYQAKRAGGARWELYGPELRDQLRSRRTTENRLRRALADGGVVVRYQPVVDLSDGHAVGAEALVRLKRGNRSLQSPETFIHTAEESGLVIPLGQQVLEHACQQPQVWQDRTHQQWFVSVNVSPRQLSGSDLVATTTAALEAANLPAEQLRLEITEEAILDIGPKNLTTLRQLRALGVQIGVDDFGTGRAAMSYVRHMPLDFIKIDRSFVAGMGTDHRDLAMVEATLALSHRLKLQCIAEGIETPAQWAQLRELGCDHGQGFLFARPTTSERIGTRETSLFS